MESERDNFEFALSQFADGTLSELDRRDVEERLLADAESRLLVSDYARVDAMLQASRELPDMDFDAFAVSVSRAIEAEESPVAASLRMPFLRWMAPLTIAAAVAIAVFVGLHLQPGIEKPPKSPPAPPKSAARPSKSLLPPPTSPSASAPATSSPNAATA